MTLYNGIVYFFEAVAAISAIALIFTKNVLHGALFLIITLLAVAGIYVLVFAEFLAVTQIMVYAGGVLVVIIFGIMLTARLGDRPLVVDHYNLFFGSLTALGLFVLLCYYYREASFPSEKTVDMSQYSVEIIGVNLMTEYLLPFEIAGILLLVALIGAAVIASGKTKHLDGTR